MATASAGLTRRTETSKYPQEKKSNEIPLVVASERGIAQTISGNWDGVVDKTTTVLGIISGTSWETRAQRVRPPYTKI